MTISDIARIVHEANRAYCRSLGDTSQVAWDEAPEWQSKSVHLGVINFLDLPFSTPEQTHNRWWKHKRETGWAYGEVKDEGKRIHPCCVPYNKLPHEQQVKDKLFLAIVNSLLGSP